MHLINKEEVEKLKKAIIAIQTKSYFVSICDLDLERSISYSSSDYLSRDKNAFGKSILYSVFQSDQERISEFGSHDEFDGIRPVLDFSKIKSEVTQLETFKYKSKEDEPKEIEVKTFTYGEYPESISTNLSIGKEIIKKISTHKIMPTSQKYTLLIDEKGKKTELPIYKDVETGEKYLVFINSDKQIKTPTTLDYLSNNPDLIIMKFKPITWFLDDAEKIAVPIKMLFFGRYEGDYQTSPLAKFLESDELLEQIGVKQTPDIEVFRTEKASKRIFKKGKQDRMKLEEVIKRTLVGGKRVPYLVGHPGIGKTQIINSLGPNVVAYNVSTFTPDTFTGKTGIKPGDETIYTDSNGVTHKSFQKGTTFISQPEWYIELIEKSEECRKKNERCILFLDEFDKLTPNMQVFINGIVDDPRTIAGWEIPDNVDIILAGNTEEYSQASMPISGEVLSRLNLIEVRPNIYDWIEWAVKNDVDPIVVTYLMLKKDKLLCDAKTVTGDYDYSKSLNPRSWDQKISEAIKTGRVCGEFPILDDIMDMKEKESFEEYIETYSELDIDSIIKGNYDAIIEYKKSSIALHIILTSLIPYTHSEEKLTALLKTLISAEIPVEIIQRFKLDWLELYNNPEDVQMFRIIEEELQSGEVMKNG